MVMFFLDPGVSMGLSVDLSTLSVLVGFEILSLLVATLPGSFLTGMGPTLQLISCLPSSNFGAQNLQPCPRFGPVQQTPGTYFLHCL